MVPLKPNKIITMKNTALPNKKVKLKLVGLDGNAFALMGAWRRQALKEKWTGDEVDAVLKEAMAGDYSHLLYVLSSHCK